MKQGTVVAPSLILLDLLFLPRAFHVLFFPSLFLLFFFWVSFFRGNAYRRGFGPLPEPRSLLLSCTVKLNFRDKMPAFVYHTRGTPPLFWRSQTRTYTYKVSADHPKDHPKVLIGPILIEPIRSFSVPVLH